MITAEKVCGLVYFSATWAEGLGQQLASKISQLKKNIFGGGEIEWDSKQSDLRLNGNGLYKRCGFLLNLGMCHFYLDLEEGDLLLCIYIYYIYIQTYIERVNQFSIRYKVYPFIRRFSLEEYNSIESTWRG